MSIQKIKFQGNEYLLVGETSGAIATEEQYSGFAPSFAHLFPDGRIMRYGTQIGTRADVEFLGPVDAEKTREIEADGFGSFLENGFKGWTL
jgi:hypothetical protein